MKQFENLGIKLTHQQLKAIGGGNIKNQTCYATCPNGGKTWGLNCEGECFTHEDHPGTIYCNNEPYNYGCA